MEQNDTKKLTDPRMVIAAECLANPDFAGTKEDIAREAGVSRGTLYRWLRNPDFLEMVNHLIDQYTAAELGMVWKSLLGRCRAGDLAAIKMYFEMKDRLRLQEEQALRIELLKAQVQQLREKRQEKPETTMEDDPLTKALKEMAERMEQDAN